ncbi:VPLPA-CTERM sorting domain-containing protein [Desulfobacter curvatus]|uniref:VPLPA-CTERM sorting domain-containing protein n=1 Tax=Desulfobacter curvatus TaxID=2290 RepID=UPI000364A55C|nr:VPLPA-CTERM sorting domain-containing protein [Desulfobacter curvatus]
MKKIKLSLTAAIAAVSIAIFAISAPSAFATTTSWAFSSFDYDSFDISFNGGAVSSNLTLTANAEANGLTNAGTEALVETGVAYAYGEVDRVEDSELYSEAAIDAVANDEYAYAATMVSGTYTATAAGTLTFSVDYQLGIGGDADGTDITDVWAGVSLLIDDEVTLMDDLEFSWYGDLADLYNGEITPWRELTMSLELDANETISFALVGESYADVNPVPVPGAGLLMTTGLIGLAAIRRKK